MENNITKLIADYPKLIERINRNIESNEQFAKIMAESEKRRLQAEIPQAEISKVVGAAIDAVRKTACQLPETTELSKNIAEKVGQEVREEVHRAARKAIDESPFREFNQCNTLKDLFHFAPEKVQKKIRWVIYMIVLLVLMLGFNAVCYYSSDLYLGTRYVKTFYPNATLNNRSEDILAVLPRGISRKRIRQWIRKEKFLKMEDSSEDR